MTETSIMYAGTASDTRAYYAVSIAAFFRTQLNNGVCSGLLNSLSVLQHGAGDRSVDVSTGKAWVYGYFMTNDALLNLAVAANASGQVRIDRVILRNTVASGTTIVILQGTPGAGAPALTQNSTTYEISLAYLTLANGYTQILTANITDERTYATLKRVDGANLCQFDADLDMNSQKIVNVGTPAWAANTALINKGLADGGASYANLPSGVVVAFGTTSIPAGFLACDGSAVSRTTYADLFAAIGVLHGVGDGSTTFNLPLLTDRVPIGQDTGDTDFNTVGKTGGAATVTLDTTTMPSHDHGGVSYGADNDTLSTGTFDSNGYWAGVNTTQSGSDGGGGAHNNLAPYIKLAYGIRV